MKVPLVTWTRPETRRSIPGHDEAGLLSRGGHKSCTYMSSFDFGIGVKSESSLVVAGSCRNRPQSSLDGDGGYCRATDWGCRGRNLSHSCPTPNVATS